MDEYRWTVTVQGKTYSGNVRKHKGIGNISFGKRVVAAAVLVIVAVAAFLAATVDWDDES